MKYLVALFLSCFLLYVPLKAQSNLYSNQQFWLEGLVDYSFAKKWHFYTDASYRHIFLGDINWWRVMARPSLKFKILDWLDVRGGVGVFYTEFGDKDDVLEVRPWEGFAIAWPTVLGLKFTHQVRLEQRIIYNTADWTRNNSNRYRYQLSTKIKFSKTKKYKVFFIPLEVEFFFNSDKVTNKFVQNEGRYTIGLGYVFNKEFTVDGKFFVQRSRFKDYNLGISDYVFRLRLSYNLIGAEKDKTSN
jgi:hypothetical protein